MVFGVEGCFLFVHLQLFCVVCSFPFRIALFVPWPHNIASQVAFEVGHGPFNFATVNFVPPDLVASVDEVYFVKSHRLLL